MSPCVRYLTNIALDREHGMGAFFLRPILRILSWLYGAAVVVLRWLYEAGLLRPFRAPVPVISVGNLTAGGTGKTPFVVMLYRILREEGFSPMILTRGYTGGQGGVSDEAEMLKELVGPMVFTGADRVRSFHSAFKAGQYDCVILDDGFQQWRFKRDLDIVLIDSRSPFGNGALIPRGILREARGALRRAGILVLTRSDRAAAKELDSLQARLERISSKAVMTRGVHRACAARDALGSDKIALTGLAALVGPAGALCAIGDPESFRRTLEGQGIELKSFITFPDHYRFTGADMRKVILECREKGLEKIFITHKDYVKLKEFRGLFNGLRLIVIDVEFVLTYGKTDLISSIRRLRRS